MPDPAAQIRERSTVLAWLYVAVAVLLAAGLLAVLLVLGRMPPFDALVSDPDWFRRCLAVHVVLALVLWFQSFAAVLMLALPAHPRRGALARVGAALAAFGTVALIGSAWLPGTEAVMSNYVPVLDHPVFGLGLAAFAAGVVAVALSRVLLPNDREVLGLGLPAHVAPFLRAAIVAVLLAGLTLVGSRLNLTPGLETRAHYELLFWGVGHVLQFVNALGLVVVALWLTTDFTGREPMSRRTAGWLAAVAILPWLAAPLLPMAGTWSATYRVGFTRLMQYATLPVPLVVAWLCVRTLRAAARDHAIRLRGDLRIRALGAAAVLTLLGLVLGALIREANTVVPGHYHASIGAVTAAFMAAALVLLPRLGLGHAVDLQSRVARWQPAIYGTGQAVFALGFAIAGAPRKVYGTEQVGRDALQTAGLVVMGVGGLVAVAGGIAFLVLFVRAVIRHHGPVTSPRCATTTPL